MSESLIRDEMCGCKQATKCNHDHAGSDVLVIGISLGYNTSVALVSPVLGVLFAISEERITGEKNTKKFPMNALRACLDFIHDNEIDHDGYVLAFSGYETINLRSLRYLELDLDEELDVTAKVEEGYSYYEILAHLISVEMDIPYDMIQVARIDHHTAHRTAGEYLSGFLVNAQRDVISVSYDGFGDGLCATITNALTGEVLARKEAEHSLALVYQFVTGALGFKEHQHEGKITGLAAFGKPAFVESFQQIINYDVEAANFYGGYGYTPFEKQEHITEFNWNIHQFDRFVSLKTAVYNKVKYLQQEGATREDIAASVQTYLEMLFTRWLFDVLMLNNYLGAHPGNRRQFDLVVSGGLFANVKLNRHVFKTLQPERMFVCPPMGDEGTAIGAAIAGLIQLVGKRNIVAKRMELDDIFLGRTNLRPKSAKQALDCCTRYAPELPEGVKYVSADITSVNEQEVILEIVRLLSANRIVCISRGPAEFGPRALGNHTILYDAGARETNDWLNKRLGRTEFMPFAPVAMDKFASDLFVGIEGLEKTLKYMTVAVDITDEFRNDYQAAYHIDFTARPQIVSCEDNPFLYKILSEYHKQTGKKALINTSFNLHNHPIINDDLTAIKSFVAADLDGLVLQQAFVRKLDLRGPLQKC